MTTVRAKLDQICHSLSRLWLTVVRSNVINRNWFCLPPVILIKSIFDFYDYNQKRWHPAAEGIIYKNWKPWVNVSTCRDRKWLHNPVHQVSVQNGSSSEVYLTLMKFSLVQLCMQSLESMLHTSLHQTVIQIGFNLFLCLFMKYVAYIRKAHCFFDVCLCFGTGTHGNLCFHWIFGVALWHCCNHTCCPVCCLLYLLGCPVSTFQIIGTKK